MALLFVFTFPLISFRYSFNFNSDKLAAAAIFRLYLNFSAARRNWRHYFHRQFWYRHVLRVSDGLNKASETWKRSSWFLGSNFIFFLPVVVGFDAGMGGSAVDWRYDLIRITSGTILNEVDDWTGL
mgnify:CR=1 FL=1